MLNINLNKFSTFFKKYLRDDFVNFKGSLKGKKTFPMNHFASLNQKKNAKNASMKKKHSKSTSVIQALRVLRSSEKEEKMQQVSTCTTFSVYLPH